MIILDTPPTLILPDHYQANRPAIIRPVGDLANFFPVEIDRKTRRAIVSKLAKLGLIDDRAEAAKMVDAAIPFGMFGKTIPFSLTFIDVLVNNSDTSSYSFGSVTLSDPGLLVYLFSARSASNSAVTWTGSTIAGNSVALHASLSNGGADLQAMAVGAVAVPAGSISISGALSNTMSRAAVAVWLIQGYNSSSPVSTAYSSSENQNTSSRNVTLTSIPAGGCAVYMALATSADLTYSWSGATERFDASGGEVRNSAADKETATALTNNVVSATFGNAQNSMCGASFY